MSIKTCVRHYLLGLLAIVSAWLACETGLAADTPTIESVESPAIQRGSMDRLKVVGANLASAREVIFYRRGVNCQSLEVSSPEELSLQLQVEATCPLGMHAFRLRTEEGFSELRTFVVTPYPVTRIADEQMKVKLGCSVIGQLADGQPDRYTISLNTGERLSIDIEAIRLGIELTDTSVVVRDPAGHVVAQADDSNLYRQDPILSLAAGHSGEYTIEVSDAGRNSGQQACYVMHISDGPRPLAVFPLGGPVGSTIELTYSGDCQGSWKVQQELPNLDQAENEFQLLAVQGDKTSATPLPFRLSALANFLETSANDDWSKRSVDSESRFITSEVPCALNGIIEQPLDRDCYWLLGIPGQAVEVDVYAQRLGSAADTKLTVVDSAQKVLAQSDDVDSLDSRVEFTVPKDGKFGIAVEEKRGKGGDGFAYRVEVTPARPKAEVFLPRRDRMTQDLQTVSVPLGNRVLALMAIRKDDANGRAHLRFPNLPKGLTAHFSQPAIDQTIVPVVFEAAANAELLGQLIPVEVSVNSPEHTALGQFHQVTDLIVGPADAIYTQHDTQRLTLGTRTAYPVSVSVKQPRAALRQDGTLDLMVNIERRDNFSGDVALTLPWLPAWIDAEPRVIVPATESQTVIRLRAWKQADAATWPLVVEASVDNASNRRRSRSGTAGTAAMASGDMPPPNTLSLHSVASSPVELKVARPAARGHFEVAAAEQGQTIEIACDLQVDPGVGEINDLVATLEGLPNRVECAPLPIQFVAQTLRFQVTLQPTAPLGRYVGLACRLSGKIGDESVSYVVSRDGELTIDKPGQIVRDAAGRPLNRVEALRKKVNLGRTQSNAQ